MAGDVNLNEGIRFLRIIFPWTGIEMNEYMIRNLSKTLQEISGATT